MVMPGLVDAHVHVNEPGRTDWGGFVAANRAAAAGGITTLVDMPLNSIPPTTTLDGFAAKLAAAQGPGSYTHLRSHDAIPDNACQLKPLFCEAGRMG